MRRFCFFVLMICSFSFGFTPSIKSQENYKGNVIYSRYRDSQRELVFYRTNQITPLPEGNCTLFSAHLDFMAIVDTTTFEEVRFVNLANGQEISFRWQEQWQESCSYGDIDWLNNDTFMITNVSNQNEVYYINPHTGLISGPYQKAIYIALPLYAPPRNVSAYSPHRNYVVYKRCNETDCRTSEYVIYNIAEERVITELSRHGYLGGRPIPPEILFSWSHSERYVVYDSIEHGIAIYDIANEEELNLMFLPTNINQLSTRRAWSWKWSPDDSQVAFWVDGASRMGYSFDEGLAIVNLSDETFTILDMAHSSWPSGLDSWGWSPSGDSLLLVKRDDNLYELNLETYSQTRIDSDINRIYFWYTGE